MIDNFDFEKFIALLKENKDEKLLVTRSKLLNRYITSEKFEKLYVECGGDKDQMNKTIKTLEDLGAISIYTYSQVVCGINIDINLYQLL